MPRFTILASGFLLSLGVLFAQLQFEVASIRPADIEGHPTDSLYTDHSAGLHVVNFPLRDIILFAYDIRDFQLINVPGWIDTQRYDITAKTGTPAGTSGEHAQDLELRERTRWLLADRFGLVVHHETRDLTAYALTVAKGGPNLKVVTERGTQYGFRGGRGRNQGFAVTMTMFANELARVIGRPVVDRTGLAGEYDYLLEWVPDEAGTLGVTIFTALQEQLGLRLESTKAPVDTVVIERVEADRELTAQHICRSQAAPRPGLADPRATGSGGQANAPGKGRNRSVAWGDDRGAHGRLFSVSNRTSRQTSVWR